MHLDHYSMCGLQVTFKRTKLVKADLLPYRLLFPCSAELYYVTVHLIGHMQMRRRSYEIPNVFL